MFLETEWFLDPDIVKMVDRFYIDSQPKDQPRNNQSTKKKRSKDEPKDQPKDL